MSINRFQPTVKSVIFFAKAKKPPLFTSAEAGVIFYFQSHQRKRNSLVERAKVDHCEASLI
jgi:hypothetical protein